MQRRTAYGAWDGNPPNVQYICVPMPDAPYLPLSGSGTFRGSLDSFLKQLERDRVNQSGHFFEYVWESDKEEADTYFLQSWEVLRPDSGAFEALVVMYYEPINANLTLEKHFGSIVEEFGIDIESYSV